MDKAERYLTFHSKFPDDSTEVEGSIIVPAGRNILEAIRSQLSIRGITNSLPEQYSFYGWTVEFLVGNVTIWMLLQNPDPWLLIIEARASWLTRSSVKLSALRQGLSWVKQALDAESDIVEQHWMTKKSYDDFSKKR